MQMPADILVVTPSPTLGENIRRTLEETTLYRVHVVNNKASAVVRADEVGIPLAMLDLALGESWVQEVGKSLRTIQRGINLIVLCDDGEKPPAFDELRPWILVRKPFRMNDFMTAISQPQSAAHATPQHNKPVDTSNSALWLSDENKAAQHLTRLTLSSSAQAALITRKGNLWAYAGGLSQDAAKELAQAVIRHWGGGDLLRFIRLESTKAEHMLYATLLAEGVVLAFVFDAETPFSTIRNQASQLVSDLDKFDAPKFAPSAPKTEPQPVPEEQVDENNIPPITNILKDIPAPTPAAKRTPTAPPKKPQFDPDETRISDPLSNASVFPVEASPAAQHNDPPKKDLAGKPASLHVHRQPAPVALEDLEVTAPSRPQHRTPTPVVPPAPKDSEMEITRKNPVREKRPVTPVAPPASSADVTRESPSTQAGRDLTVEPNSAGMYHLTYACLLVPRFASHYLTGDLSERIGEWMPNICIAFGWRLEYLSVRPEYLQWVVNVQPNASPGYLMRAVRQQTSERIFKEFPRMKSDNPSKDFWAPGYLIMGGTQPHPQQLVNDYIRQTRKRQGQEMN